jgi:DhnA family fructose-bisphosphate aldolase class Ia
MVKAAPIPVLIAGGEAEGDFRQVLRIVTDSISQGGAGVCMGRQVFGNKNPENCIRALKMLIHDGASFEQACEVL